MTGAAPRIDLRPDHLAIVRDILRRHAPGREVLAFGSRANWTAKPYSDLDLAIRGEEPLSLDALSALREAFEESDLPFRVDLLVLDDLPESFRRRIEAGHVVLAEAGGNGRSAPEGWPTRPLSELAEIRLSSVDKKTIPGESPVRLCNYTDVYYNNFIRDGMSFMKATATDKEIENCTLRINDVVITKDSEKHDDIGVPALIRQPVDNLVCGYHLAILRSFDHVHGPYLFYALSETNVQQQFHKYANGVTRFGLRKADIGLVDVPTPPLAEQRAIARVLGALDDRIELNRRMGETLEAMAQALFKSWFVDFDPVRAKMEGRDSGLPPPLAALFPDRLVPSDLGEIPEGWEAGRLADIASAPRRGMDPASLPPETPYIGLEHMPRRSVALADWGRAGEVTSNKSAFETGDILFGKLRPYFHKVGIAPVAGVCSTDIVVVVPNAAHWEAFALACVSSDEFVSYTDRTSTGTKMPRTGWATMGRYPLRLPPEPLARAFENATQPLLSRIAANIHRSRALAATRDALSPKLVSGEIRAREVGEAIEAAT